MANIAIDARFYGTEHTGLGRYTTNVLAHLPGHLQGQTLQVLLRRKYYDTLKLPKNCTKVLADFPHYSIAEQIKLPLLLKSLHSDLLYTFHFNTPIFASVPTIVTIHDLIKSYFTGEDTTTRSHLFFRIRRWGYSLDLRWTLSKAVDIITPTNTVKNQILANFPAVLPERIHPIPEAPDPVFRTPLKSKILNLESKINLPSKFILFVGNAYPHKNLPVLLQAFRALKDPNLQLVIVAKRTPFLSRVLAPFDPSHIEVLSNLSDSELVQVYAHAQALVTPSLMEGYGLVGLEALMVGIPVIASDIPVYREVYGDKVVYFDPRSVTDLVNQIRNVGENPRVRPTKLARSWSDVSHDIAEVIHARCARLRPSQ